MPATQAKRNQQTKPQSKGKPKEKPQGKGGGASLNKVMLMGNLGADPEVRFLENGRAVTTLSVATNETWMKEGERQQQTEWHRVVVWGKQAEACGEHLRKGRSVYVEGRNQTRKWEDKEGVQRYTTEVQAFRVLFLGGPGQSKNTEPTDDNDVPF